MLYEVRGTVRGSNRVLGYREKPDGKYEQFWENMEPAGPQPFGQYCPPESLEEAIGLVLLDCPEARVTVPIKTQVLR